VVVCYTRDGEGRPVRQPAGFRGGSIHSVLAYRGITDVREFGPDDTLTADDILPGFAVPVAELFED
jgi:hypothetical protein